MSATWGSNKYWKWGAAAAALAGLGALYLYKTRKNAESEMAAVDSGEPASTGLKKGFLDRPVTPTLDGAIASQGAGANSGAAGAALPEPHPDAAAAKKRGNDAMKRRKYQEAATHYSDALLHEPTGPNAVVYTKNRAQAYLSMGQHDLCLADCAWALEQTAADETKDSKTTYRAGEAFFGLRLYRHAASFYKLALEAQDMDDKNRALITARLVETETAAAGQSDSEYMQLQAAAHAHRDAIIGQCLAKAEQLAVNGAFSPASAQCLVTAMRLAELEGHNPLMTATVVGAFGIYHFGQQDVEMAISMFRRQIALLDELNAPATYEEFVAQHGGVPGLTMEAFIETAGRERTMRQVSCHYLGLLSLQGGEPKAAATWLKRSIEAAVESHEQQRQYSVMLLLHLTEEALARGTSTGGGDGDTPTVIASPVALDGADAASAEQAAAAAAAAVTAAATASEDVMFWRSMQRFVEALPGVDLKAMATMLAQQRAMTAGM